MFNVKDHILNQLPSETHRLSVFTVVQVLNRFQLLYVDISLWFRVLFSDTQNNLSASFRTCYKFLDSMIVTNEFFAQNHEILQTIKTQGRVPLIRFNHTSWMTVATPTGHPKSVRSRCVIEVFGGVFVLSIGFRIFCWYKGFCHRTEPDLLLFHFSPDTINTISFIQSLSFFSFKDRCFC